MKSVIILIIFAILAFILYYLVKYNDSPGENNSIQLKWWAWIYAAIAALIYIFGIVRN